VAYHIDQVQEAGIGKLTWHGVLNSYFEIIYFISMAYLTKFEDDKLRFDNWNSCGFEHFLFLYFHQSGGNTYELYREFG